MTTEDHCWWGKLVVLFWDRKKSGGGYVAVLLYMTSHKGFKVWFCVECNVFDWQMLYLEGHAACTTTCCEYTKCRGLHVQITYSWLLIWQFRVLFAQRWKALCRQKYWVLTYSWALDVRVRCQAVLCSCVFTRKSNTEKHGLCRASQEMCIFIFILTFIAMNSLANPTDTWAGNTSA